MSVSVNVKAPRRMIKEVKEFYLNTAWMRNITREIKKRILKNTAAGKDYRSRNFRKYSDAYAKRKGQRKVDLELTETMIKAVVSKVINALTGVVYVKASMGLDGKNRAVLAEYHNFGQGHNPVREFMNVPKSVMDRFVKKYIDDEVQKIINRNR